MKKNEKILKDILVEEAAIRQKYPKGIGMTAQAREKLKIVKTKLGLIKAQGPSDLDLFLKEFVKNGGNATLAVQMAFKIENEIEAAKKGTRFLKEATEKGRLMLEKKEMTYGRLLDVAIDRMGTSKAPDWWDRIMKIGGYEDFLSKGNNQQVAINIVQNQEKLREEFGFSEEGEVIENGK